MKRHPFHRRAQVRPGCGSDQENNQLQAGPAGFWLGIAQGIRALKPEFYFSLKRRKVGSDGTISETEIQAGGKL
jgi:hypothetical protein